MHQITQDRHLQLMRRSRIISTLVFFLWSGYAVGQLSPPGTPTIELLETLEAEELREQNPEVATAPEPITENNALDRRGSLLESPWKIGYGKETTGAGYNGELYTVTNTNDSGPGSLRRGIETSNTWVIYDPSLNGKTIYLKSSLHPAANTTWDGRDALVRIAPHSSAINNITMIRFKHSNSIMHRVSVGPETNLPAKNGSFATAQVTAILVASGENYWLDHITVNNADDDSLGIGDYSKTSAIDVTVTHYKVFNANKGLLIGADQKIAQNANRARRVTIAWSDMAATCRNFRNSGGQEVHGFNNYAHDWGGFECGTISGHGEKSNRDGPQTPIILVESSVFSDNSAIGLIGQSAATSALSSPNNPNGHIQGYVFTDGLNIFESGSSEGPAVINPGDSNNSGEPRLVPPYKYTKLPAAQVKAYVLENAGADGANIVFPDTQ